MLQQVERLWSVAEPGQCLPAQQSEEWVHRGSEVAILLDDGALHGVVVSDVVSDWSGEWVKVQFTRSRITTWLPTDALALWEAKTAAFATV